MGFVTFDEVVQDIERLLGQLLSETVEFSPLAFYRRFRLVMLALSIALQAGWQRSLEDDAKNRSPVATGKTKKLLAGNRANIRSVRNCQPFQAQSSCNDAP
jgi:hypothetical protein